MATEILIPKLGMTMTAGTVAEWYVADGTEVQAGQRLYRLETEKIEFQVEAEAEGVVRHLVPAKTKLAPGAIVGYILAPGEPMPASAILPLVLAGAPAAVVAAQGNGRLKRDGGRIPASPIARRLAKERGVAIESLAGTGPAGRVTEADVLAWKPAAAAAAPTSPAREVPASPLARALASQLGVDLRIVRGSGPGGRVTKEDVEAAAAVRSALPSEVEQLAPGPRPPGPSSQTIPLGAMRRTIAERMHASLQEMAQLTMAMDVGMDECVKLRSQLIDEWQAEGIRPSYTDLVIKAVAKALRQHPGLNARFSPEGIELLADIHLGMAVALDGGLVVPVVREVDLKQLKEIAAETSRLALAARDGKLGLDEMAGATFSVTTLGMAGVDFFTPIVNPPNVAILGVGRIRDAVAWDGDRPLRRQVMTLSLTVDHRAVDGAPGAAFLGAVRDLLEAPYRLLV